MLYKSIIKAKFLVKNPIPRIVFKIQVVYFERGLFQSSFEI